MSKQINITARPKSNASADEWVGSTESTRPRPKRLTCDLDPDFHTQLKVHCATRGINIADLVRDLLRTEVERDLVS